jgi:NAD(P)H-flavin reductase
MSAPRSAAIAENPWLPVGVQIADVVAEISGVATYHLKFQDRRQESSYRYLPGQFNMLYVPGVGEIAISISGGLPDEEGLAHTVRVAGNVTQSLARLGIGESLALRGPYGSAWPLEETQDADAVVIAGGIGLAPLRPVVEARLGRSKSRRDTTLLYGARSPDTLLFTREFDDWTRRGLDLQCTVDRPQPAWTGHIGAVPLLVDRLPRLSPSNCAVFLCGPEVMMRYCVRSAVARGLRKDQIWVSLERNMQCAAGLCGHCQLGPAFVCLDGPIFRYDRIEPFFDVEGL